jgi:hypothetical protein
MKQQFKSLSAIAILVVLITAMLLPVPVKAAAPVITGVSPNTIVNNVNNAIKIAGTDFADQAQVNVGSQSVVVTSFSPTELIIRIPAGFEPGTYSITVTNPGPPAELTTVSEALQVFAPTPTPTPTMTSVPSPTSTPVPYSRPQLVVDAYSLSVDSIKYGQDFNVNVSLDNAGGSTAYGIQAVFSSSDLLMLKNGGISAAGDLGTVGKASVTQTMTMAAALSGVSRVSLDVTISYSDEKGTAFTDKFTLFLPITTNSGYVSYPTATATPTPTGVQRSQLVIKDYETDISPLQPGYQFTLTLSVQNVGSLPAKGITMIVGGGSVSGSAGGTPQPGGISGGSGEFTNFAPVGTSNIQSLGDFAPGATVTAMQKLIVNVSANPGAYPMKITFSYTDNKGNPINDEQVITLLVYSLPSVDVGFYQPVGELVAGQPGALPLQVTSLGKRTTVLGKMKVTTAGGMVENGEALIGSLDPGGYFTLDSMLTPNEAGPLELTISIEYIDDFNQPQTITKTLSINVIENQPMPTPDPNNPDGGVVTPAGPETIWQKIWRFILGLFGLDSSAPSTEPGIATPTQLPVPQFNGGAKG